MLPDGQPVSVVFLFLLIPFFSRIRRRAAHLCIKKKKYGPLQTPPPHSGPSCEGLLKQKKKKLKEKTNKGET
jgi:hypothetical protein